MQLEPGGEIPAYVLLDPENASACLTQLGMASSVPAVLQPEEGAHTPTGDEGPYPSRANSDRLLQRSGEPIRILAGTPGS